ncbi:MULTISPECIES: hypothetical protein [Bacillus]|uniref:Uncharacterized protein n=5 Tax=Bacillus cereus group TaxID=86661 RepID=A0AAC8N514_BACAN|nr:MULTISPECIES: hypothetical protein [Bacillus]EJT17409.1 hypothetical protein B353_29598 [Bacillus anthracis str. UR-1]EXJ19743.1 hypothetical protein Y693_12290 [Bacillus anthracis str. 95014]AAP26354.1 hypothetical protein BA_2493 [Bacillus anthracis str. Ames]AAT35345.1 hypothetical protein GBAA_2493 [Bacillus anthracis str. 'Ames Ancestor']AAT54628.1 hypothetical protein BAS2316 [Bacillus anthracis str. Sterne]
MNKQQHSSKKKEGFFENRILPIITVLSGVILLVYKGVEFISKYVLILILFTLIIASLYLLFMKQIVGAAIGFIFAALGYYMYKIIFKQKRNNA